MQGVFLDITQRKNAELKLMESELKYRSMFDNNEAAMFRGKIDGGIILDCNEKFLSRLGCTREEVQGNPSLAYWADPLQRQEMVRLLKAQGHVEHFEFEMVNRQGEVKTCLTSVKLYPDGIVEGSIVDITDRKRAELELEQKYEALERVAESIGAGLAIIGKDYRVVWANTVLRNLGVSSTKKCFQTFNNLETVCPDCGVKKVFEQNAPIDVHEYKNVNPKGEVTWVELRVTPLKDKNGNVTSALELAVPINERKKAEEELENNKNYFETLMTSVLSGIIVVDSKTHRIVDANPAALKLIGASKEEVVGKVCHKFICPEEVGKCPITDLGQTMDKAEMTIISANGERHPIIKSVVKVKHNGRTLLVENFVDISVLKRIEEMMQRNQNRLELMNEKLKVVGGLTRHDVRNKLSAVNGYAYLLKKKHADKPDIVDGLTKMEQSVKDSVKIFDFAKVYEQLGVEELVDVDVEKTVNDAVGMFSDLTFKVTNNCHGLTVRADSLLRQLVYNLVDNTRKYGKKTTDARVYYVKTPQGDIQLIYEDDGMGIPLENKEEALQTRF